MPVAEGPRPYDKGFHEFVAASSEHSDDDMLDDEGDDLQLANVHEDQANQGLQVLQAADRSQEAVLMSSMNQQGGLSNDRQAAFDIVLQGIVQALQFVSGISSQDIKDYVGACYIGVSTSLLLTRSDVDESLARLVTSSHLKEAAQPYPTGCSKKRYIPTLKATIPAAPELAKIVAWAGKLADQASIPHQHTIEAKWRRKAADAVVMHCLHDLRDGQLESRSWGVVDTSGQRQTQQKDLSMTRVRCPQHIPAAQLEGAFAMFSMPSLPKLVASAAESHGSAHASAPLHATQLNETHAPPHRQTASVPAQPDLHTSATEGAASGMAPPAYATQMDGPNDMFDASPTAAASMDELGTAADPDSTGHSLRQTCGKHDRSASQELLADAPAKKAKSGLPDPLLQGMPLLVAEDRRAAAPHLVDAKERLAVPAHVSVSFSQQQLQQERHLDTAAAAPVQLNIRSEEDSHARRSMPDHTYAAAAQHAQDAQQTQHAQHTQQAQHAQHTQQAQHAQRAQHAQPQIRAAMPSSLGWGLSSVPQRAAMQHRNDMSINQRLPAYPDQWQQPLHPAEIMPARAVPHNVTWMQLYTAAHATPAAWVQDQGRLWQPPGQASFFQPQPPCAEISSALPPALAQQDLATGQWAPTLMPMNPYVIDQMARAESSSRQDTSMQGQPASDSLPVSANSDAEASRKRKRGRCSRQPNAEAPAKAVPAEDHPVRERMQDDNPAQLADHQDMPGLAPTVHKAVRMPQPLDDPAMSSMHQQQTSTSHLQWHPQAQVDGNLAQLWPQQAQADGNCPQLWHQQEQADGLTGFAPTRAQQPTGQNDVIDLCSPASSPAEHRQQHGYAPGAHASAAAQMWQNDSSGRTAAMPGREQAKSRLHKELTDFAVMATATEEEEQNIATAVEAVRDVTALLWEKSRTVLFGSQATGLAVPGSDLDIVVLGVSADMSNAAAGFTRNQRELLGELLEDLVEALRAAGMLKGRAKIIDAKVPIIKCTLDYGSGLAADISLGAVNGAAAVKYVRQMVSAAPPLRVLVLFIKSLLKETMLNEVFTGGLSSYSIVNMVMTHLLCMGFQLPDLPGPVGDGPGFWGSLVPAPEFPEKDVGELLLSFFDHFGSSFNYVLNAVSVGQGGVVMKKREWQQADRPWLLAVEDPQQLGKDIGAGTYNIRNVQHLFAAAAATLRGCMEQETEEERWAAVQADGASSSEDVQPWEVTFPILSQLIVVATAIGRDSASAKKRQQQAKQAPHQSRLSVLASHQLLKQHLSMAPPPAPTRPSFPVGRKGKGRKKNGTHLKLQACSKKQKKKAKQAREKARAQRPQTRSQDAVPGLLHSQPGMRALSTRQQSQKLCYMDMTDEFVPLSQQKKGKSVAQPAASGAAPSGQHLSRKQRKANRQAQQTQGPAKGGGRGRGASGGVQKKKGGKFAQRKRHTT